ncbi:MAG: YihY/virulence factor BrkB family protein [Eubacterium sp.]|nr:YihY/virulence factor BrkB family protein [Eubacterium sp.]
MTFKEKLRRLKDFLEGTADEHIGAFAAQTAFFIFLSFFPMVSLLMSASKFLPVTQDQLINLICNVIPGRFEDYVISIVSDIYAGGTYTMTIISAVIALWSSAKGLMAIRNGLNEVYRSREQRNYLIIRGISSVYTALFLVMLIIMIPLNMFGTQIVLFVINKFPAFDNLAMFLYGLRTGATFIVLFLFFWLLYTIVPNRRLKFIRQIPGALFTAGAWVAVTKIISIYVDQFLFNSYMYGSLTMVILMMMWLYVVSSMIFVGAQINEYLYLVKYKDEDAEIDRKKKEEKERKRLEKERRKLEKAGLADTNVSDVEADATESVTDGSIDTDISETTEENRVVAFDKLKKKREKRKLKKVSDDDNFTNDEITGE